MVLTRTIPAPDTGQQASSTGSNGSKSNRSLDALLKVQWLLPVFLFLMKTGMGRVL